MKLANRIRNSIIYRLLEPVISFQKFYFGLRNYPGFIRDYLKFNKLAANELKLKNLYPNLEDKTKTTNFDRHYIYHTAWASRVVNSIHPEFHIDISSSLYFSTLISAFVPVRFYDYRPVNINLSGLVCGKADLTNLPFEDNSIFSISCMHTVEHIGLGRYGDPIDPNGDKKAISELKRVVKPGGHLIFVTPVGKPRVMFNGHRIYSFEKINEYFKGFDLQEFALVPDNKEMGFLNPADPKVVKDQEYGCGCFWFTKKK
jgi:SAM-dependent methyltransferase